MHRAIYLRRINGVVAAQGAAQVVLLTQIPLIGEYCDLGLAAIAGLVALGTLCLMLAGPLWGELGDRFGRRPVLLAGLAGTLLAQGLFVALLLLSAAGLLDGDQALLALGASRIIYGLSAAAIYPCCQAWTADAAGGERLAALSRLSAAANLGRGLGPLLALPTLAAGGLWPLLWLILLPLCALLLALGIPARGAGRGAEAVAARPNPWQVTLFALALFGTASIGQLQLLMGPAIRDIYDMSAERASLATALVLAAAAAWGFLVQRGLVQRLRAPQLCLAVGALLVCGGTLLLALAPGGAAAPLGLLVFVTGSALLVPGYSALLSAGAGRRNGRLFGRLSLMHTGGYTLGFALGGWIYTRIPAHPLLGMQLCAGLIAAGTLLALAQRRRESAETRPLCH